MGFLNRFFQTQPSVPPDARELRRGSKTTREGKMASVLTQSILEHAARSAKEMGEDTIVRGSLVEYASAKMMLDFAYIYFLWVDRLAWSVLHTRRDALIDAVRHSLIARLATGALQEGLTPTQRATAIAQWHRALDSFLAEYASYRVGSSPTSDSLRDELFYQFGKRVARTAGVAHDAFVAARATACALRGVRTVCREVDFVTPGQ